MLKYYDDEPAEKDLLHREKEVSQVAELAINGIKSGTAPQVIGIYGKYGSGKTTFLRYLKNEIIARLKKSDEEYIFVEFKPDSFASQKELQRKFLNQLLEQLNGLEARLRTHAKKAGKLFEVIAPLLNIIVKLGIFTSYIPPAAQTIKGLQKLIKIFNEDKPLDELKKKVDKEMLKSGVKFFIFIDEIDRLRPKQGVEVLQLVGENEVFKNTVYIVAYHRAVVDEWMVKQYTQEGGEKHLMKTIHRIFPLPEIESSRIRQIFFEKLQFFFEQNKIPYNVQQFYSIWDQTEFKGFFNNIRDINYYINELQARLVNIYKSVHIPDFLILEVIQVFDYWSYSEIYKAYKLAVIKRQDIWKVLSTRTEFIKKSNYLAFVLAKRIFSCEEGKIYTAHERNRIADMRCSERYFTLSISPKDFTEDTFSILINDENNAHGFLLQNFSSNYACDFMETLSNVSYKMFGVDADLQKIIFRLLSFFRKCYNDFPLEEHANGIFDTLITMLLKLENVAAGYQVFLDKLLAHECRLDPVTMFLLGKYYDRMNTALGNESHEEFKNGTQQVTKEEAFIIRSYYLDIEDAVWSALGKMIGREVYAEPIRNGDRFFARYFTLKYAELFPNAYCNDLVRYIENRQVNKLVELLCTVVDFSSSSRTPTLKDHSLLFLIAPGKKYLESILNLLFEEEGARWAYEESSVVHYFKGNAASFGLSYNYN